MKNNIEFEVSSTFIKNIIETNYPNEIKNTLKNILGKDYSFDLIVKDPTPSKQIGSPKSVKDAKFTLDLNPTHEDLITKVESKYIEHMNPNFFGLSIDKKKTFDNFIVGPSNNMAFVTALAVAKEPSQPGSPGRYPSLYIYSNSGLGKTHLLHAVANGIQAERPNLVICLITAREFMKEMINSIQDKTLSDFQKKYSEKIDILMIDDIHELENKHGTQNEFFHIFNELHNKGKQLIFTSDKSPKEIDGIAERIRTRLQWGLVIDIQKPDLETRMAILKRKAYELDLFLPDEIISLIGHSVKTSIRELEGSLIKLSAYSEVMKVEIDTEMVKELLMLQDQKSEKKITLENIAKTTANHFKIPLADLKSKSRTKEVTKVRHIAMFLSQKIIGAKLQEIGKYYGGRDHTSVMHGIRKISSGVKKDHSLSRDLLNIENFL